MLNCFRTGIMTSILEAFVPVLGVLGKSDSCDRPENLQLLADEFKPSTILSLKSTSVRQPREGADTTKTPVIKQTVSSSTNYVDNVKSKNNVFGGQQIVLDIPSSLSLKEKQKLREKIVDNGGQLSYIVTNKSHIVIHIQDSSQKNLVGEKLNKALKYNIPVVTEDFIDACLQANKVVDPQPYLFIRKAQGEAFHRGKITVNPTKPIRNKTFKPLLLNSLSVYPYEGLDGYDLVKGIVLKGNHKIQHLQAVVKMGDSSHDTSKNQVVLFLVIELHVSFGHDKDSKQQYCIFTHQGNLLKLESSVRECRYVESPEMALSVYTQLYNKATSSPFFMKSCTHVLHTDLGSPAFQKLQSEWSKTAVNVSPEVLGLVDFLWTEAMGHLTTFLSVPPAQIPQWKIDEAEGILSQLEKLLKEQNIKDLMVRLSQEFYSVLPHHPQHQCPILDKKVLVQKQDLCQVLRDMASVSETTGWMTEGRQYAKYQALRCHITYLHESSEEYERIKGHILESQKRDTGIQVHNIFCVQRDIETAEFFYHLSNHKELYHATRSENLVGILSRGLHPPVSVQTEYDENQTDVDMLGAGIYFADSASTCIKYSDFCKERGTRFLLVCKVALGKIYETYMFDTTLTSPPEGFDSVQGVGNSEIKKSYFMDNEFVVYDKNHQQLCYLVEFSIPEEQSLISMDLYFYRCDVKDAFLCKLPFDEKEIFEYNTNIDDVSNVEDSLTKVTVGLQMLDSSGQQLSLPLQTVHVRAQMFDLVSKVVVFQVYKNPHKKPVEAKYVFPLETGSAVCGFEAYINNKHVVGKVKKKEKAHEEYKEAIKKGHGGYLMDQETPDIFTVSVGNLPSNCTAIIKITYVTEIAMEGDLICFSVPSSVALGIKDSALQHTTQTTTETVDIENLHGKFSLQMCIEMPFLIQTIQSPTHKIKIKKTETKAVVAVEECNMLNVDFNLLIGLAEVHVPRMWVERHPEEESQACMLTFYPEFEAPELQQPEIVLCIDASNSMKGAPFQDALKVALLCLNHLPEKSLFNLVAFGSENGCIFRQALQNLTSTGLFPEYIQDIIQIKATVVIGSGNDSMERTSEIPSISPSKNSKIWAADENDKREVKIVSTIHDSSVSNTGKKNKKTGEEIKEKPLCVLQYHADTKGVDYANQYLSYYSILSKTEKKRNFPPEPAEFALPMGKEMCAAALHYTATVELQTDPSVIPKETFSNHIKNLLPSMVKEFDESMSTPISVSTVPSSSVPDPLSLVLGSGVSVGPSSSLIQSFQELFPSSRPFTSKIKKEAEEFLKHLTPNLGNTELFRPLRSYHLMTKSDELVNMLVITDGFVNNEGSVITAARKSCSRVRVFTMGVSSTVNQHFLKRVSHHGAGCFEFFDPSHKSKWIKKIKAQLQKAVQPVLTNVCVEWKLFDEDAPLPLQAPRQIMSLFSGNRQIVYGFVSHCHMAILKAEVCGQEISTVVSTSELSETVGLVLHKLTARSVIYDWEEGLLDENRIKQLTKKREQEEEIVDMSTKFGIVCSLTSFVAIEERSEDEDIYGHKPPLDELLLSEDVDILPYIGYEGDNSHLGILCTTSTTLESNTGDQEKLQRNFNMESDADSSDDFGFGYIDLFNDDTDVRFNELNSPPVLNIEKLTCVKNFEDKLVMDKPSAEDKVDGVDVEAKQVQSHSEITRKLVRNVKHFQNSTLTDHQDVKYLNEEFVLEPAKDVLPFKAKKSKTMASSPTVSLNRLELKEKLTSNALVPSSTLLSECIDETMEKNASLTTKKTDIRLSTDRTCESLSQSPETKSSLDECGKSDLDSLSTSKNITTQAESTSSDIFQNKLELDKANTTLSSATLYEAPVAELVSTPPQMKMKSQHGMVKKMAAPPPPPPFTLAQSAGSSPSIQPLQRRKVVYAADSPLPQQITPGYLAESGTCGFSDSSFPASSGHLSIVTSSTDIFGGVQSTVPIFSFRNTIYPASSDHQSVVTSSSGIFGGVQSTVPSSTFSFGNTVFSASSDNQSIVTSSTGIFGGVQSTVPTFSFGNTIYPASSDHQSKETSGTGIFKGTYSFPTGLQSTTTSSTFSFGNKTFSVPSDDQSTVMVDKTMSGNTSVSFPTTLFSAEQNFLDLWGEKKNTEDNNFYFCNLNMSEQSQNTSKQTSKKKNLKFKCVAPKHRCLSSKIKQAKVDNTVLYVSKYQKNNEELIHQESDRFVEEITCLILQALSDISNFKGGGVPFTSTVLKHLYKLSSDNLQLKQVLKHIEHDLSSENTKGEESVAKEKGRINEGGQFIMDLRLCQKKQGYWNEEDCIQLHILKNSMMPELETEGIGSLGTKVSVSILRLLSSLAVLSYLVIHNRLLQETLKKASQQPMTVEILEELSKKCAEVLIKNFPVSLWLIKAVVYICAQDKSYSWVCSSLGCRQSWEKFILKYIDLSKTFHTSLMWEHV
ncbi:uncharacterized protein LOC143236481 [Tachypleus tridentatus]|uniref:uncharacterized protein LOC143236481 n=1 Tax=Tachypleus tridentatus TaxID=6853 RepID=UPI003FD395EC